MQITSRCQHRCLHCYADFVHGDVLDMPDTLIDLVVKKCATTGLLSNVTLVGGEPFIDPMRLISIIRQIWMKGAGTMEIFIPSNGRWVTEPQWENIVQQLVFLGQWFPAGLRIAFSQNEWNLAQLDDLAPQVMSRWAELEKNYPDVFYHRTLVKEELLPLGRARQNLLATPGEHVGVNCSFDDWYDPIPGGGFCTDYLAFYPNGDCGLCYVYHSPVIGTVNDDFSLLLKKRRDYLIALRRHITGEDFGTLYPNACLTCKEFYPKWSTIYSS